MDFPSFCNGSYESMAVTGDAESTSNWYYEPLESPGATSRSALYPTPGVEEIASSTSTPGRAHFFMAGREFAVQGTAFNEIDQFGTITNRGTVAIGSNPATIASNGDGGDELFVTSGDNGYVYDLTANTLTQVAALNGKATMCDHLGGRFLVLDATSSTVYFSALLDGTSWTTGTDFFQRSQAPDPWDSMKVNGKYIWLFGEQTSEAWYDTGESFPYAAHPSGLIAYGIAAPFSVSLADGSLTWLGASQSGDRQVLKMSGFTPEVVSDYPRHKIFATYDTISDAQGETINYLGHLFYRLSFPTENITWAWDAQTQKWFRWVTWISEDNQYVALRPRWHANAFGEHRLLDAETGSVYRMAADLGSDVDDREIRRERVATTLMDENRRLFFSKLELDLEPGLGAVSGQGEDPQVMLQISGDGGKTWGAELWRSAGKLGEYGTRVHWERLGCSRRRVFRVVVSDPIPWRITNAYLDLAQQPQGKTA